MNLLILILFAVAAFFIAGVTGSVPLLIWMIFVCLMIPVMFLGLLGMKRTVFLTADKECGAAEKGDVYDLTAKIDNRGKVPVGRIKIKVLTVYSGGKKKGIVRYGGADCGETDLKLDIRANHCGLMKVAVKRIRVYDYLSFFSLPKKVDIKFELAVYPKEKILFPGFFEYLMDGQGVRRQENFSQDLGREHGEIRQLREYHEGDDFRSIHWKLTARTGEVWVKEYEKERNSVIDILAQIPYKKKWRVREADLFYELLSGLVIGLLSSGMAARVSWYDRYKEEIILCDVRDRHECRQMLYQLYRAHENPKYREKKKRKKKQGRKKAEQVWKEWKTSRGECWCVTADLCLYRGNNFFRKFSKNEF